MTWLCVQASAFLSFVIVILCLASVCITMVRCVAYIHELCMTLAFDLNIKIIFSPWIWVWQDVFTLWHRQTKFWHMGVSPWDNFDLSMTLTLIYMWLAGVLLTVFILFYSGFKEVGMYCFSSPCHSIQYKNFLHIFLRTSDDSHLMFFAASTWGPTLPI